MGVIGIEPMLSESKSEVLPLHNTPTLAEEVRFELTGPRGPTVFKTVAINRALPLFQKIEFVVGR